MLLEMTGTNYAHPSTSLRDAAGCTWILPRPKKVSTGHFVTLPTVGPASSNPCSLPKTSPTRKRDVLSGKQHIATGRSFRSASFRILVDLGNCSNVAFGGQQDSLLAMRAYCRAGACSRRKPSRWDIERIWYL